MILLRGRDQGTCAAYLADGLSLQTVKLLGRSVVLAGVGLRWGGAVNSDFQRAGQQLRPEVSEDPGRTFAAASCL